MDFSLKEELIIHKIDVSHTDTNSTLGKLTNPSIKSETTGSGSSATEQGHCLCCFLNVDLTTK